MGRMGACFVGSRWRVDNRPFLIYALPRSRTAWLSMFLTYRDWTCLHEVAIQMRDPVEISRLFRDPRIGSAETAAAPGWQIIEHYCPGLKRVVIRRPIDDVVASVIAADVADIAIYDEIKLRRIMEREARDLTRISALSGTLTVDFADLATEDGCAAVFEHCLPYKFDRAWFEQWRYRNIQVDIKAVLRYYY